VDRDPFPFAGDEKFNGFAVQQIDLAKIESYFKLFLSDESAELIDVLKLKSSRERKFHGVFPSLVSRNFQHGLDQLPTKE